MAAAAAPSCKSNRFAAAGGRGRPGSVGEGRRCGRASDRWSVLKRRRRIGNGVKLAVDGDGVVPPTAIPTAGSISTG